MHADVVKRAWNVEWYSFIWRATFTMEARDAWTLFDADVDSAMDRVERIGQ